MTPSEMLFWLLVGHALADYPLQGDFLAKAKNRNTAIPGVPWWLCLSMHSLVCAGAVAFVTGSMELGLVEYIVHGVIDVLKCEGAFGFTTDQVLHVLCKVVYVLSIYGIQ